ncbi:MAG: hypothetical protein HQ492_08720 [Woeseiaceae bacterium]|nr:hypothetical protein [Woeseiaceae bacterium]
MLAAERRRVFADWRALILARRVALSLNHPLPKKERLRKLLTELAQQAHAETVSSVRGVYQINAPYAELLPVAEEHVVAEANPLAVLSHQTALAYHGLTNDIPKRLYATHYGATRDGRRPLGTTPEDWVELSAPRLTMPKLIGNVPIIWSRTQSQWDFGHEIGFVHGVPVYLTDLERTLVDSIRSPEACGGLSSVFRAWHQATECWNLDRLISYVERFDIGILRQRAGFLIESLGSTHVKLDQWQSGGIRGGSAKLSAADPFTSRHSERWNLSLNVPDEVLAELQG